MAGFKIEGGQIDANDVDWTTQDVRKVYDGKPLSAFPARATDKHGNELNVGNTASMAKRGLLTRPRLA